MSDMGAKLAFNLAARDTVARLESNLGSGCFASVVEIWRLAATLDPTRGPFAADTKLNEDRRKRCESPLEEAMFDLLVERGYRVDTQVPVGTKRIDLVVEGGEDRRLAIECDGDAFHGPDRWPDDMARQRMLERAGWTVWRCFASRFVRERDAVIAELVATLTALGIDPASSDQAPASRFSEQRRWRATYEDEAAEAAVPYAWLVPADPFDAALPIAAE